MQFAPGARRYALPALVLAALAAPILPGLAGVLLAGGVAILAFFRDPDRTPEGPGVLAPADGRVTVVRREGDRLRVGVFMNVTDVHVNRAPVGGDVRAMRHEPGAYRPAFSKDSDRNERLRIDLGEVEVALVAGWFARRIRPYVQPGGRIERGERIGHIAFGSRADVLLPPDVDADDLAVDRGDRVRAGETVLVPRSTD